MSEEPTLGFVTSFHQRFAVRSHLWAAGGISRFLEDKSLKNKFFRFRPMWWFYEVMTICNVGFITLIGVAALGVDRPSETDGDISDVGSGVVGAVVDDDAGEDSVVGGAPSDEGLR